MIYILESATHRERRLKRDIVALNSNIGKNLLTHDQNERVPLLWSLSIYATIAASQIGGSKENPIRRTIHTIIYITIYSEEGASIVTNSSINAENGHVHQVIPDMIYRMYNKKSNEWINVVRVANLTSFVSSEMERIASLSIFFLIDEITTDR